jgi:hypothetical protein
MKVVPLRLQQPDADLRLVLEAWMGEQAEQACCRTGASTGSWIQLPATPSSRSLLAL